MPAQPASETVHDYPHGRVPRALRERQVLALAEELFAERGYEGASMDELARRAGVSKPVIYTLVASKEVLFQRCFERAGLELAERVAVAGAAHLGDLEAELRATALAFFGFLDEHEHAWAVLFQLDAGGRTHEALANIRERQANLVAARLMQVSAAPDARRAEAVAYAINGAYEALAHWRRDHPETTVAELADWLVDLVLPGIEALGPAG